MNVNNTQQLFAACPILFRGRTLPASENLMAHGFLCGDGRFELLMKYAAKLEAHLVAQKAAGVAERELPMAVQVKDLNGTLRMILNRYDEMCEQVVAEIAYHSESVCDICGNGRASRVKRGNGHRTLCAYHASRAATQAGAGETR